MQNASKKMYSIGNVFNIIMIVLSGLGIVLSLILMIGGIDKGGVGGSAEIVEGIALMFYFIILLVFSIVARIFAGRVNWEADFEDVKKAHILMIVFGALSNLFYLLGGIFGLIPDKTE